MTVETILHPAADQLRAQEGKANGEAEGQGMGIRKVAYTPDLLGCGRASPWIWVSERGGGEGLVCVGNSHPQRPAEAGGRPSEAALAEQFGVNCSTIREGIRLLEHGGLVQRANGGKKLRIVLPH